MYRFYATLCGSDPRAVEVGPDLAFPEPAMRAAVADGCRLLILGDPHNPTGAPVPAGRQWGRSRRAASGRGQPGGRPRGRHERRQAAASLLARSAGVGPEGSSAAASPGGSTLRQGAPAVIAS